VLIKYDSDIICHDSIVSALEKEGMFETKKAVKQDQVISKRVSSVGENVGKLLFGIAVEKALENTGLSFMAAFI
jgi:hypothetical protein